MMTDSKNQRPDDTNPLPVDPQEAAEADETAKERPMKVLNNRTSDMATLGEMLERLRSEQS